MELTCGLMSQRDPCVGSALLGLWPTFPCWFLQQDALLLETSPPLELPPRPSLPLHSALPWAKAVSWEPQLSLTPVPCPCIAHSFPARDP